MLVYRVENAAGLGPYQTKARPADKAYVEALAHMVDDHNNLDTHPTADIDFTSLSMDGFFGFASKGALLSWFQDHLETLFCCGFHVACYEVPGQNIWFGRSGKQLWFTKRSAQLINTVSIDTLL